MKQVLAVAFFAMGSASRLGLSAERANAKAWLRGHPAPQQDELSELRSVNPSAYALVKALLTKRSLGLLDPLHPSASFSAPPPRASDDGVPSGANAFAVFATPPPSAAEAEAAPAATSADIYSEVAAPKHHDWLNWKPADSALSDDAMVKNVLGAVAGLSGSRSGGRSEAVSVMPAAEAPRVVEEAPTPARTAGGWGDVFQSMQGAQAQLGEKVAPTPVVAAHHEQAMDFGLKVQPAAAPADDNSFLKGLDFKSDFGDAPKETSALASFSWGDDAPGAAAPPAAQQAAPQPLAQPAVPQQFVAEVPTPQQMSPQQQQQVVDAAQPAQANPVASAAPAPKKVKKNALLGWLGSGGASLRPSGQEAGASFQRAAAKPTAAPDVNPYAAYLA